MMSMLLLSLMACSAWAATTPDMMMTTMKTPDKPCCLPKRWQGTLFNLKGGPSALDYVTVFVTDADMKKEGYMTLRTDGGGILEQGHTDYNKNIKYTVNFGPAGGCKQDKPEHDYYDHCFGGNTTLRNVRYVGDAEIGGIGSGIQYDAWTFTLDNMDITMTLSRAGCIPLLENIRTNDPNMVTDTLILFNDVTTTITETHLLDIPDACKAVDGTGTVG